jgi:hypothetical protein
MRCLRFLALAVTLFFAGSAQAKREQVFSYPYVRVWTTAVRMMRVDFSSPITEKDQESGYFLFDYPDSGKSYPGSVEIVRVTEAGLERARVVVTLEAMPSYVEQMLLDRLTRKLGEEYGEPSEVKHRPDNGPSKPGEGQGGPGASGSQQQPGKPDGQQPKAQGGSDAQRK